MPAVTADTLTLPKVNPPAPDDTERPVRSITTGPRGVEGEGFPVVRAFAGVSAADLDPFVHKDQMGEVQYQPGEPRGTDWHPHRGFETVTYMIDGRFAHQDSHGGGGLITDGATQWMTAGAGILHIETPPAELVDSGGLFHGVQLWVNLPAANKWADPVYQDLSGQAFGAWTSPDGGDVHIIAGEVDGQKGPGSTHTPITYLHASIPNGGRIQLPWKAGFNGVVYVLEGSGTVGASRVDIQAGQTAVLTAATPVADGVADTIVIHGGASVASSTGRMEVLVMGGAPIREQIAWYGPFVMNTKEEIEQAVTDYQHGRMGVIPPKHDS